LRNVSPARPCIVGACYQSLSLRPASAGLLEYKTARPSFSRAVDGTWNRATGICESLVTVTVMQADRGLLSVLTDSRRSFTARTGCHPPRRRLNSEGYHRDELRTPDDQIEHTTQRSAYLARHNRLESARVSRCTSFPLRSREREDVFVDRAEQEDVQRLREALCER
jgi:hypothetical protein